jgi:hypothetical protein
MFFPQFLRLPTEIHSLILDQCFLNDEICLRLTSKYLYHLPHSPLRPYLPDPNIPSTLPLFNLKNWDGGPECDDFPPTRQHRYECHALMKHLVDRKKAVMEGESPDDIEEPTLPENWRDLRETKHGERILMAGCTTNHSSRHCLCFDIPLHKRLYSWVKSHERGKDLAFCWNCQVFTVRKKRWGYKCRSSDCEPKQTGRRSMNSRRYTRTPSGTRSSVASRSHHRTDGFSKSAMDLMERRLRDGLSDRNGTERYEMRMIPGQDVKTGNMREWRRGEWRRV